MPTLSELETFPHSRQQLAVWGVEWPPKKGWKKRLRKEAVRAELILPRENFKKIVIEFDGGTTCNHPSRGFGVGYGSYKIGDQEIQRVKFGLGHSCNSAEIRTLTAALEDLADQMNPASLDVMIRGDSRIALKWASPSFTRKSPQTGTENFREAIVLIRAVAIKFGRIRTEWRGRHHSVMLFGH